MAKRKAARARSQAKKTIRTRGSARRSGKRPTVKARSAAKKSAPKKKSVKRVARAGGRKSAKAGNKSPKPALRLNRARRTLDDIVPTPPSSLDMDRRGTAARSGRAGIVDTQQKRRGMGPAITGGDVDVDVEDAYFTGEGAPGGDNPGPDEEVVDDIGRALGVEYQDNEELKSTDKIDDRDRHRWELDPASSDDYKDRK
jgi:hypothetical protein